MIANPSALCESPFIESDMANRLLLFDGLNAFELATMAQLLSRNVVQGVIDDIRKGKIGGNAYFI